jgi:hypothetical protein
MMTLAAGDGQVFIHEQFARREADRARHGEVNRVARQGRRNRLPQRTVRARTSPARVGGARHGDGVNDRERRFDGGPRRARREVTWARRRVARAEAERAAESNNREEEREEPDL